MNHDLVIDINERLWKYDSDNGTYDRITGSGVGEDYCVGVSPDDLINLYGPLGTPGTDTILPVHDKYGDSWYYSSDELSWVRASDNLKVPSMDRVRDVYGPLDILPRTPKPAPSYEIEVGMFIKPVNAVYEVLEVFDDQTAEVRDVDNDDIHHVLLENYEETEGPPPAIGEVWIHRAVVQDGKGMAFIVKEHVGNHTITLSSGTTEITLDFDELQKSDVWNRIH